MVAYFRTLSRAISAIVRITSSTKTCGAPRAPRMFSHFKNRLWCHSNYGTGCVLPPGAVRRDERDLVRAACLIHVRESHGLRAASNDRLGVRRGSCRTLIAPAHGNPRAQVALIIGSDRPCSQCLRRKQGRTAYVLYRR